MKTSTGNVGFLDTPGDITTTGFAGSGELSLDAGVTGTSVLDFLGGADLSHCAGAAGDLFFVGVTGDWPGD